MGPFPDESFEGSEELASLILAPLSLLQPPRKQTDSSRGANRALVSGGIRLNRTGAVRCGAVLLPKLRAPAA